MKIGFKILIGIIGLSILTSCMPLYRALKFSPSAKLKDVHYNTEEIESNYTFYYSDTTGNLYLRKLRTEYSLDSIANQYNNELDKIKAILGWANKQWTHNGNNNPEKSDALSILKEAAEGKNFRCVEYGIVASAALNSIGIQSRVLSLKTRDVEKVKYGAGHVVAETYSKDLNKWIFIDPQYNAMPVLNEMPLNGIEFRDAIYTQNPKLKIVKLEGEHLIKDQESYIKWVGKYLYFFDTSFDQRVMYGKKSKKYEGKTRLMLVPIGEENPTIFQKKYELNYCIYTNLIQDFYQVPKL